MLGPGSPVCQFMDASAIPAADARGRVRSLKLPSQPLVPSTYSRFIPLPRWGETPRIANRVATRASHVRSAGHARDARNGTSQHDADLK